MSCLQCRSSEETAATDGKKRKEKKKERGGREKGGPSLLHIINNHITVLWPFSNYLCCINYPEPEVKLVV